MAWTLCSKADVLSITNANAANISDFMSDSVEGLIRQHQGEPYLGLNMPIVGELYDGDGSNILILKHPPILSVQMVQIIGLLPTMVGEHVTYTSGAYINTNEYMVTSSGIELRYMRFPVGKLNISMSYTSGSAIGAEIDPVYRLTAAAMIVAMLNYKGRQGADSSLKWGTAPEKEGGQSTPNINVGLTSHLQTIMKRMLVRGRVRVR